MSTGGLGPLTFSEINPTAQTAQLAGDAGTSTVTLIATAATWAFIEVTDVGNVNVTQIFLNDERDSASGIYRAVHSRQSSTLGAIIASQHYGKCKASY